MYMHVRTQTFWQIHAYIHACIYIYRPINSEWLYGRMDRQMMVKLFLIYILQLELELKNQQLLVLCNNQNPLY